MLVSALTVNAATLTCQQISDTSLSISQFSTSEIEIRCSASGGTVSNVQITTNSDPSTGLTISSSQTISSSISSGSSSTAKWSVTGDSPNTYSVSYTISSDGTESWSGASTTSVEVPTPAQLTVEYVLPPSLFTPSVETLDFRMTNIGGTTASNVKMRLNSSNGYIGSQVDYPTTIAAGASASYSWTNTTGFNESGTYTTTVYLGSTKNDAVTATVNAAGGNITQNVGWNMMSLSSNPSNKTVPSVLSNIWDNLTIVWGYNASESNENLRWLKYDPDALDPSSNTLQEFDIYSSYWVRTDAEVDISISGDAHSTTNVSLYTGWNMAGYPANTNADVNDSITSIVNDIVIIWSYDSSESDEVDKWKKFDPTALDPSSNTLENFTTGSGYWFRMSAPQNFSINW
ncbi:hypothetical protein CMO90_02310 [Candidatus Woesearchaeota archaeon]|nr:hypothetical protein [Candidatus Woesearchaeota archaeon]